MTKIGVSSSKTAGSGGRANKANKRSSSDGSSRAGGLGLRLGKRTARVAPARTVFVAAAESCDPAFAAGGEGEKPLTLSPAHEGRMASNGNGEEQEMEVDAELSPGNNGEPTHVQAAQLPASDSYYLIGLRLLHACLASRRPKSCLARAVGTN